MVQSLNLDAVLYLPYVSIFRKSLAIPHFSVADISKIDPRKLKEHGFTGLVFDKDNTLTAPYGHEIYPTIRDAVSQYQKVFGNRIVIMSNSAGTRDDKRYESARRIERELGIKVLRHKRKKPAGIRAVRDFFSCDPAELVMFGDRIFTDVVFGNRYGMLTVHTALLTEEGDNKASAKARKHEIPLIRKWKARGITAPPHRNFHEDICLEVLV